MSSWMCIVEGASKCIRVREEGSHVAGCEFIMNGLYGHVMLAFTSSYVSNQIDLVSLLTIQAITTQLEMYKLVSSCVKR